MLILDSGGLYAVLDRDEEAGLLRLAAGRALPEIAGDLGVSISTVHVASRRHAAGMVMSSPTPSTNRWSGESRSGAPDRGANTMSA